MSITADDVKSILSVAAFAVSLVSLYFTRVNWLQSNRPVVSAFITEQTSGNQAATFSLSLANTGNRPAVRVRLHASDEEIRSLLDPRASAKRLQMIAANFSPEAEVPLLRNGEELTTSFGAYIATGAEEPWLSYGQVAQIRITYEDLEGRKFSAEQPLRIYARHGFGGGAWSEREA